MKKSFITLGLMAFAALTLSCAKQETVSPKAEEQGIPFEIVAGNNLTKTSTTDAATINWVNNDALNVFVAENGGAYADNKKFTVDNVETGNFKGTLASAPDPEKNYDWKVFYPYDSNILTVNSHNGTKGYIILGSQSSKTQTQAGNSSKAHLAGSNMPLYGVKKNVSGADKPVIELAQVLSVIKVHVTNSVDTPIPVSAVSVSAPEGTLINGTFFLDFSGDTPVFESSGNSYTSNTASLTVSEGAALAKNASADFFIAVKPFTLATNDVVEVTVNGLKKQIKAASAVEFKAGQIKTLNFNYDQVPIHTIADVIAGGAGSYNLKNVLVYAANTNNAIVGDGTGKMLLYKNNHEKSVGDKFDIDAATVTVYNGVLELTGGTFKNVTTGNEVNHGDVIDLDVPANATAFKAHTGYFSAEYITMKGTQDNGKNILNAASDIKLYMNADNAVTKNKNVIVTGYSYAYSSQYSNFNFHAISIELDASVASLEVDKTALNWAAAETDAKTVTVTATPNATDFTVAPTTDANWNIGVEGNVITVSPKAANESTTDAKTLTLTITHKDDGELTKTVTCTQAKATSGSAVIVTYDFTVADNYPTGFPTATGTSAATATTFTIDGKSIKIKAPNAYYMMTNGDAKTLFFGKSNTAWASTAYIEIPAKDGYYLESIAVKNSSNCAANVSVNIYAADDETATTVSTAVNTTKGETMNFTISSTTVGVPYRISSLASGKNFQFDSITVTYNK